MAPFVIKPPDDSADWESYFERRRSARKSHTKKAVDEAKDITVFLGESMLDE